MRVRTDELIDRDLDRAVSRARGEKPVVDLVHFILERPHLVQGPMAAEVISEMLYGAPHVYGREGQPVPMAAYSSNWSDGGPIIEAYRIGIRPGAGGEWLASRHGDGDGLWTAGPTPLVAAMRCFALATLGEHVDL